MGGAGVSAFAAVFFRTVGTVVKNKPAEFWLGL
jgi:hypothetical protein